MIICAAQIRPSAGDVVGNLAKHEALVERAAREGAAVTFFPELSITGYEPRRAGALATTYADERLDVLQSLCDAHNLRIGVGIPLRAESRAQIGMVWFTPKGARQVYAKQMLHADELPFFIEGQGQLTLGVGGMTLAPAICYESLQPDHAAGAASLGADVYVASVAKSTDGVAKAMSHYPAMARRHNMYVVMSNCVGPSDDFVSMGQSAAWDRSGLLLAQLGVETEGLVVLDTSRGVAHVVQGLSG